MRGLTTLTLDPVKAPHLPKSAAQVMLISYAQLTSTLITGVSAVCLLDCQLGLLGASGVVDEHFIARGISAGGWPTSGSRTPMYLSSSGGGCVVAISLEQSDGSLLGAFCLQLAAPSGVSPSQFAPGRRSLRTTTSSRQALRPG